MESNTLINVLAIAALVFVMIRGCGGGMCGMGSHRRNGDPSHDEDRNQHATKAA